MYVVASDTHRRHHGLELSGGRLAPSEESPDRADIIIGALRRDGHRIARPNDLADSVLETIHTTEYIDLLRTAWELWVERGYNTPAAMGFTWPSRGVDPTRPDDLIGQLGYHSFAADCSITEGTWEAVRSAAAIAVTAADHVLAEGLVAYALCRPPGHHATADQFGGYCFVNNSALAAQRFLDGGSERVAVLDLDYHHGNGTQDIFYERSDVLTISLHADPSFEFPWFTGHANETGRGEGAGWNLNLPLPAECDADSWSDALRVALDRIRSSGVERVVVALGVDTFVDDPLGTFTLTTADYSGIAEDVASLGLPTVIVQEGGYAVADIGANVASFLRGFER